MAIPASSTSAVVTGAARGIGRAIAERLVAAGHRRRDHRRRRRRRGGDGRGDRGDGRRPGRPRPCLPPRRRRGRLGAGAAGRLGQQRRRRLGRRPRRRSSDEQVRGLVDINLLGVLWGMRAALDAFDGSGGRWSTSRRCPASARSPGLRCTPPRRPRSCRSRRRSRSRRPPGSTCTPCCPTGWRPRWSRRCRDGTGKRLVSSGGRLLTTDEIADGRARPRRARAGCCGPSRPGAAG